MDAKQEAEYVRLHRAFENGPNRRVTADMEAGRDPTRADMEQGARYTRLMVALQEGRA